MTNTGRRLIDTLPTVGMAINYAEMFTGTYEIVDRRTEMLRATVTHHVVDRTVGRERRAAL